MMNAKDRAQFGDSPVVPKFYMVVRTELRFSLVMEDPCFRGNFRVIRRNDTAFPARDDFGGVERGGGRETEASRGLTIQCAAMGVRRVLNERDMVLIANLSQSDDVRVHVSSDMDDDDRADILIQGRPHGVRV